MGIIALIIVLATLVFLVAMVVYGDGPDMPSPSELDAMACTQMREQGWTEDEIEKYMDDCGGYYDDGIGTKPWHKK